MVPALVLDEREVEPLDEVIREERVPVQVVREDARQVRTGLRGRHPLQARLLPRVDACLDDERRARRAELVGMRDEEAVRVPAEDHDEAVKELARPEPDVAVLANIDGGLEEVRVRSAQLAMRAIRAEEKIAIHELARIGDGRAETNGDTEVEAAA